MKLEASGIKFAVSSGLISDTIRSMLLLLDESGTIVVTSLITVTVLLIQIVLSVPVLHTDSESKRSLLAAT